MTRTATVIVIAVLLCVLIGELALQNARLQAENRRLVAMVIVVLEQLNADRNQLQADRAALDGWSR